MSDRNSPEYLEAGLRDGLFAIAYELNGPFETDLVSQVLEDAEIPFALRLNRETAFSFLFQGQRGYGVVLCRAADLESARALLAELKESEKTAMAALEAELSGEYAARGTEPPGDSS